MIAKRNLFLFTPLVFSALLFAPVPAFSEDHGSGSGSEGGCGDVFGDLIHILRDDVTGQPILAKRWVELPAKEAGYGWGYCPIAVYHDEDGNQFEIPFLDNSCDIAEPENVEAVDYFGRLNGGRTKERNNRMHFNEVISNIKQAGWVTTDEMGRLKMGFRCPLEGDIGPTCYEWASVDSPMESMGLYSRFMKYGHIATDPYEIDYWSKGDPKRPTQFNPALTARDMEKFDPKLWNLLPDGAFDPVGDRDGEFDPAACWDYTEAEDFENDDGSLDEEGNPTWTPYEPFYDMNENCVWDEELHEPFTDLDGDGEWYAGEWFDDVNGNCVRDEFVYLCAAAEHLDNADFVSGATVLAAASSKTGFGTVDLAQYVNRILKITKKTEHTVATLDTLPALIRDCWDGADPPFDSDHEYVYPDDALDYVCSEGYEPEPADIPLVNGKPDCNFGEPNHCLFPDVQERFVDFSALTKYVRAEEVAELLYQKKDEKKFETLSDDPLISWVENVNGVDYDKSDINGFVSALNDYIRTIEYVHNYAVPENLFIKYGLEDTR